MLRRVYNIFMSIFNRNILSSHKSLLRCSNLLFFIVLGAGIIIRSGVILSSGNNLTWEDELHYDKLAVKTSNYLFKTNFTPLNPSISVSGYENLDLGRPPLYPLFLSFIYGFSNHSLLMGKFMNVLFYLLYSIAILYIVRLIFPLTNSAIFILLLIAVDPVSVYVSATLLTETLFTACVSIVLALCFLFNKKSNCVTSALLGATSGIALLARESFLPFIPFLIVWVIAISLRKCLPRKAFFIILVFFVSFVGIVLIRTTYNFCRYKVVVPVTSTRWVNIYLGNNPDATPYSRGLIVGQLEPRLEKALKEAKNDLEREKAFRKEALLWIKNNPLRFISLTMQKMVVFWSIIPVQRQLKKVEDIHIIASILFFLPVFVLALSGIVLLKTKWLVVIPLAMWILTVNLTCGLIFPSERFRTPAMPFVEIFAGYALSLVWNKLALLWKSYQAIQD